VFLLAWIFLAAAVASLYAGLSDEGRSFLYLSMAASAVVVVLVVAQLRRGSPARAGASSPAPEQNERPPEARTADGSADQEASGPRDSSSPER
jgi:hypothetical protein